MTGSGEKSPLYNPTTEAIVAETSTEGIDFSEALAFARDEGGPTLRAMTFAERGEMLVKVAKAIHEHREELIDLAIPKWWEHSIRCQI